MYNMQQYPVAVAPVATNAGYELDDDDDDPTIYGSNAAASYGGGKKGGNILPLWGNADTMNINPLILTNITSSPYFKVTLFEMKTYHEIVDEIYFKVAHLEPWEKGSRKTSNQTGMCGGVRGVGTGGIVSSAYCLLYKLGSMKLTRKQVNGLINHCDSPYIRGLGFMYIRYCQPPSEFWNWFKDYLDDEEEIDVKAGGGKVMTIGAMCRSFLERLEWFDTRFPRIPVNTQKEIVAKLAELYPNQASATRYPPERGPSRMEDMERLGSRSRESTRKPSRSRSRQRSRSVRKSRSLSKDRGNRRNGSSSRDRKRSTSKGLDKNRSRSKSRDRKRSRSKSRERKKSRSRSRDKKRTHSKSHKKKKSRSRSKDRKRSKSKDRERKRSRSRSRSKDRKKSSKHKKKSRSRSKEKKQKRHSRDRSPKTFEEELKHYKEYRSKHKKHKRSRSKSR